MKALLYSSLLLFITTVCFTTKSIAQEPEMVKKKQMRNYYRTVLEIDSVKADQVSQIQENYKTEMKKLMADSSVNDTIKRARIDLLIRTKNQKLKVLLSPVQQKKIIPTTELNNEL